MERPSQTQQYKQEEKVQKYSVAKGTGQMLNKQNKRERDRKST